MWQLLYRREVENDVVDAITWYEGKRPGLGKAFLSEYMAALQRIREHPLVFAVAANGLRPCRLKCFSCIVHFDVNGNDVLVLAVIGTGRDESAFIHRSG